MIIFLNLVKNAILILFLIDELKQKNNNIKIYCFNTLSEGFTSFNKSKKISTLPTEKELTEITTEEKKSNQVRNIISSITGTTGTTQAPGSFGLIGAKGAQGLSGYYGYSGLHDVQGAQGISGYSGFLFNGQKFVRIANRYILLINLKTMMALILFGVKNAEMKWAI